MAFSKDRDLPSPSRVGEPVLISESPGTLIDDVAPLTEFAPFEVRGFHPQKVVVRVDLDEGDACLLSPAQSEHRVDITLEFRCTVRWGLQRRPRFSR